MLTAQRLREVVFYDGATGEFKRLSNGKRAGHRKDNGYIHFTVDGQKYSAHRLAWLYVYGGWPVGDVDHINGARDDNRITNLRDVSRSTNLENLRGPKSHNKSTGVLGAYFHKPSGRFMSRIQVRGVDKYLGLFDTADAAGAAYLKAKRELHTGSQL